MYNLVNTVMTDAKFIFPLRLRKMGMPSNISGGMLVYARVVSQEFL